MSKHLKRLAAPRVVKLHRKERKWTTKPSPGPHAIDKSIPLNLIVRDYLNLCDTYRESKRIIADGHILIDGAVRKNHKFPCGFMDVISIPKMKKDFRVLFDQNGKITLVPISTSDAQWKLCRIENKSVLKGNKMQLNLHDGRNIIVKKDEYKTGDVLKISFSDKKISDVFQFSKGNISMIIGGSHIGQTASIKDVEITSSSKSNLTKLKADKEFSTIKDYVFPVGKAKPVITLPEVKMK